MNSIKREVLDTIINQAGLPADYVAANLTKSARPELGDYSLACFRAAKEQNIVSSRNNRDSVTTPQQLATELAATINPHAKPANQMAGEDFGVGVKSGGIIEKAEAVAGYVNIFIKNDRLPEIVLAREIDFDKSIGTGKTIVIDYSSPNIAKPFGIGHLRSTVIGNAIYRIYSALGYKCVGENFLGDWGTQFGMIIADYKENPDTYDKELSKSDSLPAVFLAERYAAYNERAKNDDAVWMKAREEFKKLESGDKENTAIWTKFRDLSLNEFRRIYDLIGVDFDTYNGEAFYQQFISDTIKTIEQKGITKISDGALIVDLKEYGMPPCLLRKSDGATLYAARDIAAAIHRYNTYKFTKLIYVVGADQKLHFRQFFKVLELMGYSWAKDCIHVDFGLVRFKDAEGSRQKMSTRKGTVILLENVLNQAVEGSAKIMRERESEEQKTEKEGQSAIGENRRSSRLEGNRQSQIAQAVGIGAIIFNDLKNKRIKDVDFDWEHMLSFDGETGPYLQYTHTRLGSLIRK